MRWIFDIENPVMHYVVKVFDCMVLSVLWMLFCLPVVTAGASTTALYATLYRYIRKGEGHLWSTFWGAFRENLKRSTLVWLVSLAVAAFLVLDVLVFRTKALQGSALGKLYLLILILCCVWITWQAFLFAYAARFHGSARDVLRLSLTLMVVHPIKAVTVFVPMGAGALFSLMAPGLLTILPAGIWLLESLILEAIFAMHLQKKEDA